MEEFLTDEETRENIKQAKLGDNEAWNRLCDNFSRYIHSRVRNRLKDFIMTRQKKSQIEEELWQAGWLGFVKALKNFKPDKGEKFITYATYYIDGEISRELDLQINTLGLTERPENDNGKADTAKITIVDVENESSEVDRTLLSRLSENGMTVPLAPDLGKYSAERRTLQIIELLKLLTDENHTLSKDDLKRLLGLYRTAKYQNGTKSESDNTFSSTLEEILTELNPKEYSEKNDKEYRIKYEGYKENRLSANKENKGKAQSITDFSYTHLFTNAELDKLIAIISFSDMLGEQEKEQLIGQIISTASVYYKSPFYDGEKIKFNPSAVHGRFNGRDNSCMEEVAEKIQLLQYAINHLAQVSFRFNRYNEKYKCEPVNEQIHTLSPYHLVVYHDNYYCIGLKGDESKIWHYRVDLMSDIEIIKDDDGKIIPVQISAFEGLPISNVYWNPEKYMAEHLYMAYDEPRNIKIKIKNTDYTILHDWFGNHYEKTNENCEKEYDIVKIKTSPSMIIHWAMQYAERVEVLDEEIRNNIKKQCFLLSKKYESSKF